MEETEKPGINESEVSSPEVNDIRSKSIDYQRTERRLGSILSGNFEQKLTTESFEEATRAIAEIKAVRQWRQASHSSPFKDFYRYFEAVSKLTAARVSSDEKAPLCQALADRLSLSSHTSSPRTKDLYSALLARLEGSDYEPTFEQTSQKIQQLEQDGDLSLLSNPRIPVELKIDRMHKRLEGYLSGIRALDEKEFPSPENEEQDYPETPPPNQDESKPSMDETERSPEGEMPPAIWAINPAYGGYYKEQSFDCFDTDTNTWKPAESRRYEDVSTPIGIKNLEEGMIVLSADLPSKQWVRLPVPYTYQIKSCEDVNVHICTDQNGDLLVVRNDDKPGALTEIMLEKTDQSRLANQEPPAVERISAILSEVTSQKLAEIKGSRKGNLAQARAICSFVRKSLTYSNDSSFNQIYESDPNGYIGAIDAHRQADCDVANTYFAALCSQLEIPARHVVGHMVKGKDKEGYSRITGGTGHAWSEVWDDQNDSWVRLDATPPGDPQLDEEEGQDAVDGDYGETEAVGPTDDQLAELEEKLKAKAEELSYTSEERDLAEAAGVELAEARQIVKEINQAEDTRLPNGEKVTDILSQLFSLIVETRKSWLKEYTGPVRQEEGGEEIIDIVGHYLATSSGEKDPLSRQRSEEKARERQIFGGLDLYIIGDKSGSMSETFEGEAKWQIQRRAEYLIMSSLYHFQQNLDRQSSKLQQSLSVRSQAISFKNTHEIDIDKPLSGEFSAEDKVRLWRSLGDQGSGNGDVAALELARDQIKAERQDSEEQGRNDDRLRLVIACSDGYPDNPVMVQNLAKQLGELNTVTVGVGLTETAATIPTIFNTEHSRGVVARDINDLPVIVAEQVVLEAIKLFPEKGQRSAERQIRAILAKFQSSP